MASILRSLLFGSAVIPALAAPLSAAQMELVPGADQPASAQTPAQQTTVQLPTIQAVQAPLPAPVAPAPAQPAPPAASEPAKTEMQKVESGLLECRGESAIAYGFGSTRKVDCEFRATLGMNQYYTGTLERAGLDFGVSDQGSMLWAVLATTPKLGPGALSGQYVGISSGASLGPGFSANVLMAKDAKAGIALQPLSVSADSGLSISLAAATLTLRATLPPVRTNEQVLSR
ncbi:DUF992 domain-containing protein [Roseixanthobacter glucoisosaccharinicivorans]|uniref:DUF992 domain-containing protein n=1 Tax=Roseixanthobacter glucoisosaccharinicivorans TaxID=3119923 RepID=UPI00372CB596